jgi:hypothetical protein
LMSALGSRLLALKALHPKAPSAHALQPKAKS